MAKKKSWREKLENPPKGIPKVVKITGKMSKRWGTGTVVIPAPLEVDAIMKKVPKGKVITVNVIRKKVAKKYKATIGCPITCGIFARIAAEVAEEDRKAGKKQATPWWRTLKSDGVLNEKYPGGVANQKKLLEKEDHTIIKKGKKKYQVKNLEKVLQKA